MERFASTCITEREFLLEVVEDDTHAERLGEYRELRTDVAVADDAEGLAANLMGAGSRLVPYTMLHVVCVGGDASHQAYDVADHQFHHGTRVRIWCIEYSDAVLGGMVQVHLVRADAEAADGGQCGACIDDRSGHRGLGTYAKHVDTLERVDEFPFRERTLAGLHFESVGAKALRGEWMNVFQQ